MTISLMHLAIFLGEYPITLQATFSFSCLSCNRVFPRKKKLNSLGLCHVFCNIMYALRAKVIIAISKGPNPLKIRCDHYVIHLIA